MHRTRVRAGVAGLILALAVAAPAAAATSTTSESFTVPTSVTVTGIPASLNYGSVPPGTMSPEQSVSLTIQANVDWSINIAGSSFAGPGGASIPVSARYGAIGTNPLVSFGSLPWSSNTQPELSGGTGSTSATVRFAVQPPATAPAGSYTGTLTWTISP
ncbi:MAG TPA: hypothetical protein VNO86_05055 [Candidatus Binatia bacterium]|nr:hypothetical protein [Candidatus Binatia bacterium]